MEKREEALREAIIRNEEETTRWESYRRDNEQAIKNLDAFSKRLVVDVMVPVSRKAYTAGQLIHTNEVMVSHYQGYFSECSSHTAAEICQQRIRMADEQLQKLKTEADLWNNKLEKPYVSGVLPTAGQYEIVEEFDDEKEKVWREEHKLRVRKAKLLERELRREETNPTEHMFIESVQTEELESELEGLQLGIEGDSNEIVKKLMSGEVKPPPSKPRVAYSGSGEEVNLKPSRIARIVKKSDLEANNTPPTNNNVRPNPELLLKQDAAVNNDGSESDDSDASDVPEQVRLIEEQAKYLPVGDQIGFYQFQLQIIEEKILSSPATNAIEIEHKLNLFKVRDCLEELLEGVEAAEGEIELAAAENKLGDGDKALLENSTKVPSKKRVSFALKYHTVEFRPSETVAQMLPKQNARARRHRDIITLDNRKIYIEPVEPALPTVDKKQLLLNKIEENFQYVTEQQSTSDFNLVEKIIDSVESTTHTLHIHFKHSSQLPSEAEQIHSDKKSAEFPRSPADLYHLVVNSGDNLEEEQPKSLIIGGYTGEEQVKVPFLKEEDRQAAYKDLRSEYSKPGAAVPSSDSGGSPCLKPIIKNKEAVESEIHLVNGKTKRKKRSPYEATTEWKNMSAYNKVMNDVIEKPIVKPDPLPTEKYIDSLAPKKRISRFKRIRSGVETT